MLEPRSRIARLLAAGLVALVVAAGCANTANPTGSVAASASASAQPAAASLPPLASPTPRAVAALKIGDPFVLVDNPKNRSLTDAFSFTFDVAGSRVESSMSGREIRQDGRLVGLVLLLEFGEVKMTPATFEAAANAAAESAQGQIAFSTILGKRVAFVTTADATFGLVSHGDTIVMVGGPTGTDAKSLLTAVIKANE
jgi:hypothetical protein